MKKKASKLTGILSALIGAFILVSAYINEPMVQRIRAVVLAWAIPVFAFLFLFSLLNTVVLMIRQPGQEGGSVMSHIAGFAAFLLILLLGFFEGTGSLHYLESVRGIQKPMETGLAGLVCLTLICALYSLAQKKNSLMTASFVLGLFVFLFLYSGFTEAFKMPEAVTRITDWFRSISLGGEYGLLIGIAIGCVVTGIRFLFFPKSSGKERRS